MKTYTREELRGIAEADGDNLLLWAADEIDRLTELLEIITADASWCGFEGDVSVNVTLWDIPQCDGRGGLTLLQAAEKARTT